MAELKPDAVVVIRAFDDVPEHLFRIDTVEEDHVTGMALTGPFAGHYGEPSLDLIKSGDGKD
ncbi:hypothetical protein [Lutimaribacter saemankumensis]|uniref:Uncharacterized protein n=1 Tax=Lutimaribacter saemankumensis TaxID=490829 RepID=A0A1G8TDY1_9RHOB|nr:hypothetical protein [Lutimaribacter saemankumensis]SDJ39115.1 hypothetical protein SAMN05421850_1205 [Lutimaribacter saemankumensis]